MTADVHEANLLTIRETAALLKQSERSIRRKIADGSLPAFRLGDATEPLRVPLTELRTWLEQRRTSPDVSDDDGRRQAQLRSGTPAERRRPGHLNGEPAVEPPERTAGVQ
jgi:excisionase family DNA binding protein